MMVFDCLLDDSFKECNASAHDVSSSFPDLNNFLEVLALHSPKLESNVDTIHWEMSVDTEEFDSRNVYTMHDPPPLDTRKCRWCNEDALYDISCGNSELEIVTV